MHTFTCEPLISRKMDCGDQNRYYRSPTIIISQIYIVQFFPTSLTGLNTTHKVIFYTMLKSLLGNEMLYNSWVHVLHITYFWSPTIYWKPSVTNHFDLFVINKDDNQHVFQSCIGLVNMEPFMANTMSTDCFRKNGYNPKTISKVAVTIFNQQHYHYCWCKTWNMDNNKPSSYATL